MDKALLDFRTENLEVGDVGGKHVWPRRQREQKRGDQKAGARAVHVGEAAGERAEGSMRVGAPNVRRRSSHLVRPAQGAAPRFSAAE